MSMKKVKLNLGCGNYIIEGKEWINVDNYIGCNAKNFIQADIRKLPFDSESVDYIFCDQVLEHIPMKDVPMVLFEMRRVLKQGGKAVIVVPDFRDAVEQWLKIDHDTSYQPEIYHYLAEVIYGNQVHEGEYHKTAMSAGYLHYVLDMVGLTNHIIKGFPTLGIIPMYEGTREEYRGKMCRNKQLVVEITK